MIAFRIGICATSARLRHQIQIKRRFHEHWLAAGADLLHSETNDLCMEYTRSELHANVHATRTLNGCRVYSNTFDPPPSVAALP